jgi:hypothetical protein
MKDDTKAHLERLLGNYDERLAATESREAAIRAAQAAFPERFVALKTTTIRPALEEFIGVLKRHLHEGTVRDQEESASSAGGVALASISLRVVPKPFANKSTTEAPKSFIEVTFSANRTERKVTVSSTSTILDSGGSRGKRGEYDIEALTSEVVATHVLRALEEALLDKR